MSPREIFGTLVGFVVLFVVVGVGLLFLAYDELTAPRHFRQPR